MRILYRVAYSGLRGRTKSLNVIAHSGDATCMTMACQDPLLMLTCSALPDKREGSWRMALLTCESLIL